MLLKFTKMHGLGNDFVVFNATAQPLSLGAAQIRRLADRHFGVGCDQVLLVEAPRHPGVDFGYRIFNADGGEVEQCGNGARCFARYVHDKGLTDKTELAVETLGGPIRLYLEADGQVRVNMGVPEFEPTRIPFQAEAVARHYTLEVAGEHWWAGSVSMGNPHVVLRVDDVDTAPVAHLGPLLESHPRFPRRVNVGFMQVVDRQHVRLRVYERGSGETLACGTGACAAAVVGQIWEILGPQVEVELPGGKVRIEWAGVGQPVWMSGPATTVFEGEIEL